MTPCGSKAKVAKTQLSQTISAHQSKVWYNPWTQKRNWHRTKGWERRRANVIAEPI